AVLGPHRPAGGFDRRPARRPARVPAPGRRALATGRTTAGATTVVPAGVVDRGRCRAAHGAAGRRRRRWHRAVGHHLAARERLRLRAVTRADRAAARRPRGYRRAAPRGRTPRQRAGDRPGPAPRRRPAYGDADPYRWSLPRPGGGPRRRARPPARRR